MWFQILIFRDILVFKCILNYSMTTWFLWYLTSKCHNFVIIFSSLFLWEWTLCHIVRVEIRSHLLCIIVLVHLHPLLGKITSTDVLLEQWTRKRAVKLIFLLSSLFRQRSQDSRRMKTIFLRYIKEVTITLRFFEARWSYD